MSQVLSGIAPSLKEAVHPETLDSVFKNKNFLGLFRSKDAVGKGTYDVSVVVESNAASVVAEEGDLPSIDPSVQQTAQFSWVESHSVYGLTGAALRALGDNNTNVNSGENPELQDAIGQAVDLANTTFLADATTGLLGHVDDATTAWGGINRTTYDTCQSYVVAGGSAALTEAMLADAENTVRNAPYGGKPELILSSFTQLRRYKEAVVADPVAVLGGGYGDAGFAQVGYAGIPWLGIPDFVTSEVVFLSGVESGRGVVFVNNETRYSNPEVIKLQLGPDCYAGLSRKYLGAYEIADTAFQNQEQYDVCLAGALVVLEPWYQAKIEALATSW